MASAVIGALRVTLGMNAGQFEQAAEKAGTVTAKLESRIGTAGANILSSFKGMGAAVLAAFGPAAIGYAIKQAIDLADETGKMAQSVGISVESLSRLEGAAGQAGLKAEDLKGGLVRLTNSLQEAQDNGSGAARAFDALGIKTKDATGNLRAADVVLAEIADKFASYADGANKTKLAVELFGKAGANMIPLLNTGARGLKEIGDKAQRFGQVITTELAKQSEEFNDTLTRLAKGANAFGYGVAEQLLPHLTALAKTLEANTEKAKTFGTALGGGLALSVDMIATLAREGFNLPTTLSKMALAAMGVSTEVEKAAVNVERLRFVSNAAGKELLSGWAAEVEKAAPRIKTQEDLRREQDAYNQSLLQGAVLAGPWIKTLGDLRNVQDLLLKDQLASADMADPMMQRIKAALDAGKLTWSEYKQVATEAINIQRQFNADEFNQVMSDQAKAFEVRAAAIRRAEQQGVISARQATNDIKRLEKEKQDAYLGTATMFASTLTAMFGKSKAAAIAAAIINTAVGITKAFRDVPWPLDIAQAALIAATGAAQIAAIRSQSSDGGGGAAPAPAGGAAAAGAAPAAAAAPAQVAQINIHGDVFGREAVRSLMQQMSQMSADGVQFTVGGR